MKYEKIKKPFALNNSYFKNKWRGCPSTPLECLEYKQEHSERPFKWDYDIYDVVIEYQKRSQSNMKLLDQYYTPPKLAQRLAELCKYDFEKQDENYYNKVPYRSVLDACCGFWMITRYLVNEDICAFDVDSDNIKIIETMWYNDNIKVIQYNFKRDLGIGKFPCIVANPPYGKASIDIDEFMQFIDNHLDDDWQAVLLVPNRYFESERPKKRVDLLSKWRVIYKEKASDEFVHTKINTSIYIIKKNL